MQAGLRRDNELESKKGGNNNGGNAGQTSGRGCIVLQITQTGSKFATNEQWSWKMLKAFDWWVKVCTVFICEGFP